MSSLQSKLLAVGALLLAGVLGGLPPVVMKIALRELDPPSIMLFRVTIMAILFWVFGFKDRKILITKWKSIVPAALAWSLNMIVFMFGIPHTTAVTSQLLYTAVPIYVVLLSIVVFKEYPAWYQMVGIVLGIIGASIVILSGSSQAGGGTIFGNSIVFAATCFWALYILLSKKAGKESSPALVLSVASTFAWIGSLALFLLQSDVYRVFSINTITLSSVLFLGVVAGFFLFFLFQWGSQRGPAIIAGSTSYISVFSSALASVILLGEKVTVTMIIGFVLLVTGVFLLSTLPILLRGRR